MAPKRVITGQGSKLGRTIHGLAYDPVHDEIVVPNALADAILVFRGSANGDEPPIRVIQGPCTKLVTPHSVSLDLEHGEILVASLTGKRINVFRWDANGNAPPVRVITGPQTQLGHLVGIAVDPVQNLMAVANSEDILVFNRTDDGNVAPRARIAGRKTGITAEPTLGFVGIWNITDNGDVPPRAMIRGPFSGLLHPVGLALNPTDGEIYVSDSVRNGILSFLVPDLFEQKNQNLSSDHKE